MHNIKFVQHCHVIVIFNGERLFLVNQRELGTIQAYWEIKGVVRGLILHNAAVPAWQKKNILTCDVCNNYI